MVLLLQRRDRHRALGLAVVLEEDRPEAPDRLLQSSGRARGRAVVHGLQARHVGLVERRTVEQHVEHRRHDHRRGDLVLLDRFEHEPGLEVRQHDDGATRQQRRNEERGARVRERCTDEEPRVLGPLPLGHLDHRHGGTAAVRAHHALRLARRAAGVREPGDRFRLDIRCNEWLRLELGRQREQVVADVAGAQREQPSELRAPLLQEPGALAETRIEHERLDLGVFDDVRVVVERPERMQRAAPTPRDHVGPEREQHLGPIGREQRHRAALFEPLRGVRLCVATHLRGDLAPGQHLVAEIHRGPIGVAVQRRHQQVGQERSFVQVVAHAVCPIAWPGPRSNAPCVRLHLCG